MTTAKLTKSNVYEVLLQTLPGQNDFAQTDYSEELGELLFFGIDTKPALLDLVTKHREAALEIDSDPLDGYHIKWYSDEYGTGYVQHRVKKNFWFAYPALLRIILELEFGEAYEAFAKKRDGI